jgi:small-conductance mechanosensitive channel
MSGETRLAQEGAQVDFWKTIETQFQSMAQGAVEALPGIAIALLVIVLTWLVSKIVVRITGRAAQRAELRENLQQLTETVVRLAVWAFGLLTAATIVVPGLTPAGLFAGLGFGAVAIGFAFKDIFENFLAGVFIMMRDKMEIGDVVQTEGILGKVERITLRETHIRQFSGELTIVPNAMIFTNPVEIITDEPVRRDQVMVGVSYDTDLDHAAEVIRKAVEAIELVDLEKGVDVFAENFGSSSVDFLVRWWSDSGSQPLPEAKDFVVRAIKKALDEAGIEIPFPNVTHTFKEAVPIAKGDA